MKPHNPIALFKRALKRAEKARLPLPNAMSLATVGRNGKPSCRMMLLKGANEQGFVFYTNLGSRKVRELIANPHASLCFWWPQLAQQVRVEGKIRKVSSREADRYFATRPRGSQIGAWISRQSMPLGSRQALLDAFKKTTLLYRGKKVPRPSFWSGFVLAPKKIEFWFGKTNRLHDRIIYARSGKRWKAQRLHP